VSLVELALVDGTNPLGRTLVKINKPAVMTGPHGFVNFTATDNELRDIEEKLRAWRLEQYGLAVREVTAQLVEPGDIIPCFGMTVDMISDEPDNNVILANLSRDQFVQLHKNTIVQVNRRIS